AHGRGGDALPRDVATAPASAFGAGARGGPRPRRRPHDRALPRTGLHSDRRRASPRARPPRPAADRGACRRAVVAAAGRAAPLRRVAPRRARGADGRGRRALPREPARRERSHPAGRVNGLALALGASLAWGVADFVGPWQARALGTLRVLLWAQIAGMVAM